MKTAKSLSAIFLSALFFNANASDFSDQDICRAAISTMMGAPVSSISASLEGKEAIVSYKRKADGKFFKNKCVIDREKNRVVWAANFDGKWGRWRNHPSDPVIAFKIANGELSVSEQYGSTKKFKSKDFEK